ncbi:hypothetical protein RhiirA4_451376 [Rhizophagus irregularis]|uniref:Uncharacterized protein n=1 Tax=Rhizophagus irregularis TaxID=588596 RepID=A0A2I1FVJ6_9GLOM|nr:hypothetical protein RhiirA4_451376 [Rhizophagus irregularis]
MCIEISCYIKNKVSGFLVHTGLEHRFFVHAGLLKVEYYIAYEFDKVTYMLAYIHWTADVREDSAGLISFQKFEAHEFIDAFAIDHCVGFFQIKTTYYVIDKDIDYTDENNRMGYIHTISENSTFNKQIIYI